MESFLKEIARKIYNEHPNPDVLTIVFPNRRAALYFRKHLSEIISKPIFAPNLITIEDFISGFSVLKVPDKLELVHRLHATYREVMGDIPSSRNESFDQFYFWGDMLLRDFDELDKYMVNASGLFKDLRNLKEIESGFDYLASLTLDTAFLPDYRNILVNGSNFTNSGSGSVQELAFSIAMAAEYLAQLTDRGIDPGLAVARMKFRFGIGSNYFMEIAKLRAARILWSLVTEAFGLHGNDRARMEIHSVTSDWNKTLYDPYVNMLRTQTEAMSAVLGGTDSLTVNPFDIAFNMPGEFSERIARNQQLLLKEEAYFDKVADPASGSFYIENLTALIADNAWKLFLEIEDSGGFVSSLKCGIIQDKIERSAAERRNDIGRRREILLGTNQYPNPEDKTSPVLVPESRSAIEENRDGLVVRQVKLSRGSEEFEKIRIAVDRASKRPVVFLMAIGNHVMRRARSQFSSGFFGCAGYEIIDNDGFDDPDVAIECSLKSNADIVVICSSDEEYPVYAPEILERLGSSTIVVVAGNPPDIEELRAKGLKNFISTKSDLSETLKYYNSCLGIKD